MLVQHGFQHHYIPKPKETEHGVVEERESCISPKAKTCLSAGKVPAIGFLDSTGILLKNFLHVPMYEEQLCLLL